MNIEVPLTVNDVVDNSDLSQARSPHEAFLLSLAQQDDDEEEGRILDQHHPYCLLLFPWRQQVRMVHVDRANAATSLARSRQLVESRFASSSLLHTSRRVLAPGGGDMWTKEVRSARLHAGQVRCTRFSKTRETALGQWRWSLDVAAAVVGEAETDVRLVEKAVKQETEGEEDDDEEEEEQKGSRVESGRVMADGWVELLVESSGERLVLMWHPLTAAVKRWHLSASAHLSSASPALPSIVVDSGRGFLSLGSHMSDPDLLAMVMVHSGATAADNLCTMNQMDRCTIPLRALEASLVHRQLDTVAFYLNSSVDVVDQWLSRKPEAGGDDVGSPAAVGKDLEDAVGLILSYMDTLRRQDSSLQSVQYCQQLAFMLNDFLIKLLTMVAHKREEEELQALANAAHRLYLRLKAFMNSRSAEKRRASLKKIVKDRGGRTEVNEPLFAVWDRLARPEVVVDGLQRNVVPLMVEYLSQQRGERLSAADIRAIGVGEVRTQLRRQSWDTAHFLLLQMGLNARDCLEEILWETGSVATRDFLLRELSARGMLSSELACLWQKVECLEEVYSLHIVDRLLSWRREQDGEGKETALEKVLHSSARRLSDCVPRYRSSSSMESRGVREQEDEEEETPLGGSLRRPAAYHRFRLFALRHVTDTQLARMLVDAGGKAGGLAGAAVARYLLDYLDLSRLGEEMEAETARWLLEEQRLNHTPAFHRAWLLDEVAARFDLFPPGEDVDAQLRRLARLRPVSQLTADTERFLLAAVGALVAAGATSGLYRLCAAALKAGVLSQVDVLTPGWARVAVEAVGSNQDLSRLSPSMARELGRCGSARASLAAALLSGGGREASPEAALGPRSPRLRSATTQDLYRLLVGGSVTVERVLAWQPACRVEDGPASPLRPHFSEPRLIERAGNRERLGFTYYLLSRRPAFAFTALQLASLSRLGGKAVRSEQRRREALLWAHQLALERFTEAAAAGACLAFTQLLRADTTRLRAHLLCLRAVYGWRRATGRPGEGHEAVLKSMHEWIVLLTLHCSGPGPPGVAGPEVERLVGEYEEAVLWRHRDALDDDRRLPDLLLDWAQVLHFAHIHGLHLPGRLLERLAGRGDWLSLLVVAQLFPFQKADLRCVLARFDNVGLRDHVSRVIDKAALVVPNPEPPPAALMTLAAAPPPRDRRLQLYTSLGVDVQSPKPHDLPLPTVISPDVSLAASYDSRTSDSGCPEPTSEEEFDAARLLAAVKALAHDSLFELLLTVRQPRALLAYAMALSHPLLAILSVCTAASERRLMAEERFSFVCAFLVASLPYRVKTVYVETWAGNLKVTWTLDEALDLFTQTLHRHSFWELENTAHIFFLGNPLDAFFAYCRHSLQTRDAVRRRAALKRLIATRQAWLRSLHVRGLDCAEGVEEELSFTHHLLADSALWLCSEVLRDLSAQDLLTLTEELGCEQLEPVFGRATPHGAHMDRLRRLLACLLRDCRLHVDAQNFCTSEEGLHDACAAFVADLLRQRRFPAARRLLAAMGGPAAARERLADAVNRAEATERQRLKARFSPGLRAALGRVLSPRSAAQAAEASSAEELLFRPPTDPEWSREPGGECPATEVHALLDAGRLGDAARAAHDISACDDLRFLLAAVAMACGDLSPAALPPAVVRAMTERRVRPRSSLTTPSARRRPPLTSTPKQQRRIGRVDGPAAVGRLLEELPVCLEHGRGVAERVFMMHRVAVAVDAPYPLLAKSPPLSVLCKILAGTIVDKLTIADFFVRAAAPPPDLLDRFLLRVALLLEQHAGAAPALAAVDVTLTPVLNNDATVPPPAAQSGHRLAVLVPLPDAVETELCLLARSFPTKVNTATSLTGKELVRVAPRPLSLGELFLDTLRRCLFEAGVGTEVDHRTLVELVVLAQQCMEAAGSTEGIAECLRLARRVTTVLSNAEQYRGLVRLLTGMRRFGEMNYVFHILLEKQHFEELLSKEATRDNRLKIAILEYLSRYRPEDTETLEMVTAYFSMMRESAETKEEKASTLIRSWTRKVNLAVDARQALLEQAVQALVFATEEYLRLQCHRNARKCFRKAQLCALQIVVWNKGRVENCRLLRARSDDLARWVESHHDFYEALVVCESAGLQPRPWSRALFEQVVLRGDNRYLAKFADYVRVERTLVTSVAKALRAYLRTSAANRSQLVQNFRFVLNHCEDVRLVAELSREFGIASG